MTNTNIENIKYERANKVSVKPLGDGYQADFYRTHKHIATLTSNETGWVCPADVNKSAEREDFRKFAIEHAADIQIEYDPEDRRTPRNTRFPTYVSDEMVAIDADSMLTNDIRLILADSNPYGITMGDITMESITPKTTTGKGTSLDLLGITDGKYLNGNWAWANMDMVVTFTHDASGQTFQMLYPMELVSGQLKKNKFTKTTFTDGIYEELLAMGLVEKRLTAEEKKALAKAEKSAKAGTPTEEQVSEPVAETPTEEKPKKTRKPRTKKTENAEQVEG